MRHRIWFGGRWGCDRQGGGSNKRLTGRRKIARSSLRLRGFEKGENSKRWGRDFRGRDAPREENSFGGARKLHRGAGRACGSDYASRAKLERLAAAEGGVSDAAPPSSRCKRSMKIAHRLQVVAGRTQRDGTALIFLALVRSPRTGRPGRTELNLVGVEARGKTMGPSVPRN